MKLFKLFFVVGFGLQANTLLAMDGSSLVDVDLTAREEEILMQGMHMVRRLTRAEIAVLQAVVALQRAERAQESAQVPLGEYLNNDGTWVQR